MNPLSRNPRPRSRLTAACLIVTCVVLASGSAAALRGAPSTEDVIDQARQWLGGEDALQRIHSVRYEGSFKGADGSVGSVNIIFQRPMQQRIEVDTGELIEVTALNDFEGWRKVQEVDNEVNWTLVFMDAMQVRRLRANTWENLHFFRGLDRRRGQVENLGFATVDGRRCVKLVFRHGRDIAFTRYFDAETGALVTTRTDQGGEIREEGEIRVEGVRFPRKVITNQGDGEDTEITFHRITLNETYPSEKFDVPALWP